MDPELKDIENQLKSMAQKPLPKDLMSELETAMLECHDVQDLRSVESELAAIEPSELEADLFENCAGRMDLVPTEQLLENLHPVQVSNQLFESLERAMNSANNTEQADIVEMPRPVKREIGMIRIISAAAALVVASVVWMVFQGENTSPSPTTSLVTVNESDDVFVVSDDDVYTDKKHFHNIVQASNAGVFMVPVQTN